MKKVLVFILAVIMCLVLAACNGQNDTVNDEETTEDTSQRDTAPETEEVIETMSKEDIISAAQALDVQSLYRDFEANPIKVKDTYCEGIFRFTGFVERFEEEYVVIAPLDAPILFERDLVVKVYMDAEDMKNISTEQVINVAGKITDINDDHFVAFYDQIMGTVVTMEDAYYIDDIVEITGTVNVSDENLSFISKETTETDSELTVCYSIPKEGEDLNVTTVNGVTYTEGEERTVKVRMTFNGLNDVSGSISMYTKRYEWYDITEIITE